MRHYMSHYVSVHYQGEVVATTNKEVATSLHSVILDIGSTQKLPDATRVSGLPKRAQVGDRSQTSKTNR